MISERTPASDAFPYEIQQQIGVGSMGVVFQALDPALDRRVAIKTLRAQILEAEDEATQMEIRQRFLQEARAAAALAHPGATTIFRVGQLDQEPFIVMEWLEGRTLEEVLAERPRLGVEETITLVASLLDTLDAAHRAGIVHRDIKPSNLLLLDDGRLKVTDFGIALLQGRELVKTQAGVVLATPRFASPEQLRGSGIDGRSDLFAVGILLYLVLTGEYPFVGDTFMELAGAILQHDPVPPREHRPDLPPALDSLLLRILSKRPEERPQTAAGLAQLLRDLLQPSPGLDSSPTLTLRPTTDGDRVTEDGVPILRDLPILPAAAVPEIVSRWESQELAPQAVEPLLQRLLERPLHAAPFAGSLEVAGVHALMTDGRLVHAWSQDGRLGEAAISQLPKRGKPILRAAPDPGWIKGLATLLHPPKYRHRDLDSSFVNLPALADKMRQEKICGVLSLEHAVDSTEGTARGWILIVRGRTLAALYTQGWSEVPVDESWQRWVASHPVRAAVLEIQAPPLEAWYPLAFAGFRLDVKPTPPPVAATETSNTGSSIRRLFQSPSPSGATRPALVITASDDTGNALPHEEAPASRILQWMTTDLPAWFAERGKTQQWKYLTDWIGNVRRARLHHDLRRPGADESDRFDLVTFDEGGKVLHLVDRAPRVDPETLSRFVEKVKAAKTARIKSGDVGAAILVGKRFDDKTLQAYDELLNQASSSTWLTFGESLTGYEGFVRIGPRRGFHLLLVSEREEHFEPLVRTLAVA